ncbi:MAG TPA: hypothetical protein VJO13_00465, partial [Ktedonobacterales bacterium]|nr:hypothetical protein [Ktedonobacterales bacterium]
CSRDACVPWGGVAAFAPSFAFVLAVVAGRVAVAVRPALLGADGDVRGVDAADADDLGADVAEVSGAADAVSTPVAPGVRTSATF